MKIVVEIEVRTWCLLLLLSALWTPHALAVRFSELSSLGRLKRAAAGEAVSPSYRRTGLSH